MVSPIVKSKFTKSRTEGTRIERWQDVFIFSMGTTRGKYTGKEANAGRIGQAARQAHIEALRKGEGVEELPEPLFPEVFEEIREICRERLKSVSDPRERKNRVYPLYSILHRTVSGFAEGNRHIGVLFPKKRTNAETEQIGGGSDGSRLRLEFCLELPVGARFREVSGRGAYEPWNSALERASKVQSVFEYRLVTIFSGDDKVSTDGDRRKHRTICCSYRVRHIGFRKGKRRSVTDLAMSRSIFTPSVVNVNSTD